MVDGPNDLDKHNQTTSKINCNVVNNDGGINRSKEVLTVEVQADCGVTLAKFVLSRHPILASIFHSHVADLQRGIVGLAVLVYC